MSVALLLVTHANIGSALCSTAQGVFPTMPLRCGVLEVALDSNTEQIAQQARAQITELDQGDGVLVLTDVYGATPCNIATAVGAETHARVLAGLNLAMLLRVFNYPDQSLDELARTAVEGGRRGILECPRKA